jgi:hypothetical protein
MYRPWVAAANAARVGATQGGSQAAADARDALQVQVSGLVLVVKRGTGLCRAGGGCRGWAGAQVEQRCAWYGLGWNSWGCFLMAAGQSCVALHTGQGAFDGWYRRWRHPFPWSGWSSFLHYQVYCHAPHGHCHCPATQYQKPVYIMPHAGPTGGHMRY